MVPIGVRMRYFDVSMPEPNPALHVILNKCESQCRARVQIGQVHRRHTLPVSMARQPHSFAVIGAGMAGATVAQALARAGHRVHVFDKARGPGGRLATRRVEWADRRGNATVTRLDHGALGFKAHDPAFQAFADRAARDSWLAEWKPRLAPGSAPPEGDAVFHVPVPDMPALCRHLLDGVSMSLSFAVDRLYRGPSGWQVQAGALRHAENFDAVLLALPPAQAAALLDLHRPDWARQASAVLMQPCWTLMGIADEPKPDLGWDLARTSSGPLAWVLRSDSRPGRAQVPGQAHRVAHARTDWSLRHLEQPAAWVQAQMQAALAECAGSPVDWHHCSVHRWRYALPQADRATTPGNTAWYDAAQGLGVCGDFFGTSGVEGAWLSAQSLCTAILQRAADGADESTASVEAIVDPTRKASRHPEA